MEKSAAHTTALSKLKDWDSYLLKHCGLPGPRASLELFWAVVEGGSKAQFQVWSKLNLAQALENTPQVFLTMCGVGGLGRLAAEGDSAALEQMLTFANYPRWRVREAVAMGLQAIGDKDPALCLKASGRLAKGSWLEQRACVAGLCEPRLLKDKAFTSTVLKLLNTITRKLATQDDAFNDSGFLSLRQTLGYGWSVAVAACPELGKSAFEAWAVCASEAVCWLSPPLWALDR